MCDELGNKAIHHVWNSLSILLRYFQVINPCRISRRIFSWGSSVRCCTLYGDGVCMESFNQGDAAYTLVQVAVNDLIILVAFAPIVAFLLGVGGVSIPWDTLILSVVLFVVIPLSAGIVIRVTVIRRKGIDYFNTVFVRKFDNYTVGGLLLTLIILFSFQGETILNNPLHIVLIAVPLVLQTVLIFFVAYGWAKWWKLPHNVAAPAGMIGASNFFELAVAVAISLFGLQSGAALATVVGVLVEVPVMLMLVKIANNTRSWFPKVK